MPMKFKKSHREYKRGIPAAKQKMKHYFMHNTPKQELFDYINSSNAKPKVVQKCMNELVRRGIKVVWSAKELSLIHI